MDNLDTNFSFNNDIPLLISSLISPNLVLIISQSIMCLAIEIMLLLNIGVQHANGLLYFGKHILHAFVTQYSFILNTFGCEIKFIFKVNL